MKQEAIRRELKVNRQWVYRVLKEFNKSRIVSQNAEGAWSFVGYERESDFEKAQRLAHSEELIPGLVELQKHLLLSPVSSLPVIQRDREEATLEEAAEEHLREAYTRIYSNISECREKLTEALSSDSQKIADAFAKAELIQPGKMEGLVMVSPVKIPGKGLGKFFPETKYRALPIPFILRFEHIEDAQQALNMSNAKPPYDIHVEQDGHCDVNGPLHFESNPEKFNQAFELYGDSCKEIQILIAKIKYAQQPLKGSCALCRIS
jgi:hypothetical protein